MDMKKIENTTKRQVMFSKRRSSLVKKINEIAICCDVDAAFIAFSPSGRLSKFCCRNRIEDVLQRYLTLPPEEKHQSNSNINDVEEKVKQLRHLSHIQGDENKLHYLKRRIKHKELQVKKSKIEIEILEMELRNYEPDPTQEPSLAELEWCENHLKRSLQQTIKRKTMLLNDFPSSFSEIPRFQMEAKNHQQSFPRENDYEKRLYSGTNHQTSDHNYGQRDAWINLSRHNSFSRAPQPQDGAPQDLLGHESIANKPTDLSSFSFPSAQGSSVGALIPQGHAKGPHAPSFDFQRQGMTRDPLVPFGITGQTYHPVSNNSMEQTLGMPTAHLPANMDNLFWQEGPHSSATGSLDCNALLDTESHSYPSFVNGNNDGDHVALYHGNPSSENLEDLHLLNKPTSENNSIEQIFGIPTSRVPANVTDLCWQNGRNFNTNDDLDCNALVDPERNIYPSFVDGNNDGQHGALYHGNQSPEKLEDLHLLNKPTSENNSIEQTFGIPTSCVPANVDDLLWKNGANDNMDCNALVDPERNIYPSFVDGNNNCHHATLYHGNLSPEKLEDLNLLNKSTSENNSIEQIFGMTTSNVPANVDDLFWQNGRNFSSNDKVDCNSLVDPERNTYPSFVDGNNDGHPAALYYGNPSPEKLEDLYLLNKPTAEEQGHMAPDNLLSIEENPENRSWEWDGYALAKVLNSDKFETMF